MRKYLKTYGPTIMVIGLLGVLIGNSFYSKSVKIIMFFLCSVSLLIMSIAKNKCRVVIVSVSIILVFNLIQSIPLYRYLLAYGVTFNKSSHFLTNATCYVWNTNYSDSILPLLVNDKIVYIVPGAEEYYKYFDHFAADAEILQGDVQLDYELIRGESIDIGRIITAPDYLFSQDFTSAVSAQETQPRLYVHSSEVALADSIIVFLDSNLNLYIMDMTEYK